MERNDGSRAAITRRTALRGSMMVGAAWATPAVVLVSAAPAYASSQGYTLSITTPTATSFNEDVLASRTMTVKLVQFLSNAVGKAITFSLSDASWLRVDGGASATVSTDTSGSSSVTLTVASGASPAVGASTTLTASYSGLSVAWTIGYRPFSALANGSNALHQLGIADGRAYSWGAGSAGQLGLGSTTTAVRPAAVTTTGTGLAGATVVAVAGGTAFSLAVTSTGTVCAWGGNDAGQLGTGTATGTNVPSAALAGSLAGKVVTAVAAGDTHALARASDGTVHAWGAGGSGRLGNGGTSGSSSPVAVTTSGTPMAGKSITAVAAGEQHSLALASDGSVFAWGYNNRGQLGTGGTSASSLPVAVTTTGSSSLAGKTVVAIAAGAHHSVALASDGTVHCWGWGNVGQLGNGGSANALVPVAVTVAGTSLAGGSVTSIAAGLQFVTVGASDGTVHSWGVNSAGQLGDGTTTNSAYAVALATAGSPLAGRAATRVHAVGLAGFALTADPLAFSWGSNVSGVGGGSTSTTVRKVNVVP